MRIASEHVLKPSTGVVVSAPLVGALAEIRDAIENVVWPPGTDEFTIYPESGKRRGEGNGVVPIKDSFAQAIAARGWTLEHPFPLDTPSGQRGFGAMDASKQMDEMFVTVEWETGNISSSHRSMNKMAVGLVSGELSGAVLVIPSARLAPYLTDRIGNLPELQPYFPLWRSISVPNELTSAFVVLAVEHDAESSHVPRIPKGTDGRARV